MDLTGSVRTVKRLFTIEGVVGVGSRLSRAVIWRCSSSGCGSRGRSPGRALASAATTPSVGLDSPAPENRPIGLQPLPEHFEPEIIKTSERGQVRAGEDSVRHVEVFQ